MARVRGFFLRFSLAALAAVAIVGCRGEPPRKVVLIGGPHSEGAGRHDYPRGIRLLAQSLASSPDAAARKLVVESYPDGWPQDPAALDDAATVVWYFDGRDQHPLNDAARRARFESLMRRGVGLVALHQASTVAPGGALDLRPWLGAQREGMHDRTTEWTTAAIAAPDHPVARGIGTIAYRDEFYPTFRFATDRKGVAPLLTATMHPQYRDGRELVEDVAEQRAIAWTYQRQDGGRAFTYSGAHFLHAFDQPGVRTLLLNAIAWTAGADVPARGVATETRPAAQRPATPQPKPRGEVDVATFHRDRARSGWHPRETVLTPARVAGKDFGLAWESPPFDAVDGQSPRLYASPLYVDRVAMTAGQHHGAAFPVVYAASSNGYVYAVNAAKTGDVAAGRILWRTRLGAPCRLQPAPLDGVPTGILSTPVIDLARKRLYVTHCDPDKRWQAYALDIGSGAVLPGWPVRLDEDTFNARNDNAGPERVPPTRRFDFRVQRGALNLGPDGTRLYVVFGETETGWLVAVDTVAAKVAGAFAAVAMPHRGSGGIWGAGGPAVDADGRVFVVTGSGFEGYRDQPHDWTQSVLMLAHTARGGFALRGTYTPFNHCTTATMDIDLGSGGALLLPDIDPARTSTPRLMAVGGKQGNLYLLDRARLPGRLDRRPACGTDAASDASLLPPGAQPQFGRRGPLNVFGPYSEQDAALDLARSRSVPASFGDEAGGHFLYVTGTTKQKPGSAVSIAPSLARVEVVLAPGEPAHLRIDRTERTVAMRNPGSPVVTSNGGRDAIVWVLDENADRSAMLEDGTEAPRPVLYAFDARTLDVLWRSEPGALWTSGKYNEPAFGGGSVFVGSDRIQAFRAGGSRAAPRPRDVPAPAQTPVAATVAPVAAAPTGPVDGAALYAQRCAICHEHAQGNIPPRSIIAAHPRERIVHALTQGAMRPHTRGLSAAEIDGIVGYLK